MASASRSDLGQAGPGHPYLKRKIVIGSKHLRKQYKLHGEQAFHPSDVPAKARQAKHEAKAWARHSALAELAKPQWNGSTSTGQPLCKRTSRLLASVREERSAAFLLAISASCPRCPAQHEPREYQHNFRAEQLPPSRPVSRDAFGRTKLLRMDARSSQGHLKRTCEAPVHASLEKKPSWNGTTRGGGDSKTRDAMTAELTRRSCAASRRRARRIATPANGYMTPTQRETARMVALRARRTATAKALQRGGPTPPEDWLAHFDSATLPSATLAWSARPSWAEASGGGGHTSSSPHQLQADPTFTGAPGTAAHTGFGDRGTAAADAQVAQLMGALPGTRPAGTGNKRGGLKSAGTATWQAGYWAHAMPPEPDVATVESVWGKGVLQGQAGVKRDFVPPAYTLPH